MLNFVIDFIFIFPNSELDELRKKIVENLTTSTDVCEFEINIIPSEVFLESNSSCTYVFFYLM